MRGGATVISSLPRLIRLIRDVRPDLVQTWMYHSNLFGLFANRRAGNAPLSWSVHSSELDFSTYSLGLKLGFKLGARLASIPDATIFNSHNAQQWHQRRGFKFRRWQYIPNAVDTSIYRPDSNSRAHLRSEIGLRPDDLIVGTVGRFPCTEGLPDLSPRVRRALPHRTNRSRRDGWRQCHDRQSRPRASSAASRHQRQGPYARLALGYSVDPTRARFVRPRLRIRRDVPGCSDRGDGLRSSVRCHRCW